jgi:hypothetical protein
MTAASLKAAMLQLAATITFWCLWVAKFVVAIGIAYAAIKLFSLGTFNVNGVNIPIPRVTADVQQLVYLAGCIWLVSR